MAVAIMVEVPGLSATQYEATIKDVIPNGQLATGCQFHVAGPMDGGWRVVDVWDSQEAFDAFARGPLAAAFQKNGIQAQPKVTSWPVHNQVQGGAATRHHRPPRSAQVHRPNWARP